MASIFLRPDSAKLQASVLVKGRRLTRSLGVSIEQLANGINTGKLERHLELLAIEMFAQAGLKPPWLKNGATQKTFSEFAKEFLSRKERDGAQSSMKHARMVIEDFSAFCDDTPLASIIGQTVAEYQDGLLQSDLAPNTVNSRMAVLSAIFGSAHDLGLISVNPAKGVKALKSDGVVMRKDLPDEYFFKLWGWLKERAEPHRVRVPDAESWLTCAMLGRYAGLRLGDAANLPASSVSLADGVCILTFTPSKTGKPMSVPVLNADLASRLHASVISNKDFLCPALAGKSIPSLSTHFSKLLELAGVNSPTVETASGRTCRQYSFHSLRHSFLTSLSKIGIPQHLAMKLSGHASAKIASGYDHSDAAYLAKTLAPFIK